MSMKRPLPVRALRTPELLLFLIIAMASGCGGGGGAAVAPVTPTSPPSPSPFTEYPIPVGESFPEGIATATDGSIWFADTTFEPVVSYVGKVTASGTLTPYQIPAPATNAHVVVSAPDGSLWFSASQGDFQMLCRVTTAGTFTEYTVPYVVNSSHGTVWGLVARPDGSIWFAISFPYGFNLGQAGFYILSPAGTFSIIQNPIPYLSVENLTNGPDGAVWFTAFTGTSATSHTYTVGKVTTSGYTLYPIENNDIGGTYGVGIGSIVSGPDGALWFTDSGDDKVGRITTSGAVTEYNAPTANAQPYGITVGPDGAIWFAEWVGDNLGRVTTAGQISEIKAPRQLALPLYITSGTDGALWFTEFGDGAIGRYRP